MGTPTHYGRRFEEALPKSHPHGGETQRRESAQHLSQYVLCPGVLHDLVSTAFFMRCVSSALPGPRVAGAEMRSMLKAICIKDQRIRDVSVGMQLHSGCVI